MPHFQKRIRFICSRAGSCDSKKYKKKHPNRQRKLGPKRIGCKCCLTVKTYPGVSTVLAKYVKEHNHPTNEANLPYVRMSKKTRELIAALARKKTSAQEILDSVHQGAYGDDDEVFSSLEDRLPAFRDEFVELRDVRRIIKQIEAEEIRLDSNDGRSTLRWVEKLRARGALLGFKSRTDTPPSGSGLDTDTFTLMVQTKWQQTMYEERGGGMLYIDATHNVTMYENLNLTTIIVRDEWGHGKQRTNKSSISLLNF
ncbi:hypothetical protein FB45DRAFT_760684 [Roridomyces roridus]|uniref:FAR1 domain-containing protein n=1 Tax=Roridomyces roridus TaxID=1738132 RepID=A0AAD7FC48_9AGAR|nr:hypothetical protein FB45DRAFT_760684 [Roridomyces roridus]